MSTLHIALQDGFRDEPVTIRVDGREVYRKAGVKTDLRISRADGIDVEAGERPTVEIEARGHTASAEVDARATPHVAVSLDAAGEARFRTSAEPFAYM